MRPLRPAVRLAAALLVPAATTTAAAQVLRFDDIPGATTSSVPVDDFYNGRGGAAFNFGVSLGGSGEAFAYCLARADLPGCTLVSRGDDPDAITRGTHRAFVAFNTSFPRLNVAAGLTGGFSFYAANPSASAERFEVWSAINGTGTLLGSVLVGATPDGTALPQCFGARWCPFAANAVAFDGVARSVVFRLGNNRVLYDDFTFGSVVPGVLVPEPGTCALLAVGLAAVLGVVRRRDATRAR